MVPITDYDTLIDACESAAHVGTAFATEMPAFVDGAEELIATKLKPSEMEATVTLDETDRDSGGVYNLPSDFLKRRAVFGTVAGRAYQLSPTSTTFLRNHPSNKRPSYYAILGKTKIEFRGVPATDTEFELWYFKRLAAFTTGTDSNAFLTDHSLLYFHGTMHHLRLHLEELELADYHLGKFNELASDVNLLAKHTRRSGRVAPSHNFGVFVNRRGRY